MGRFAQCFHQDLDKEFGADEAGCIQAAMLLYGAPNGHPRSSKIAHDLSVVKKFLDQLLASASEQELLNIWCGAGAIGVLRDGSIRGFLENVCAAIK